jgi:hypothetical protein
MIMVSNPAQPKSVFAQFDSERSNTGNLLASLAAAGLLVPVSASQDSSAEK